MIILGITHPISWNPAASLIIDGKLIGAAEEERFIRIKHAPRKIPENAINFLLKKGGITETDVDVIAISWYAINRSKLLFDLLRDPVDGVFVLKDRLPELQKEKELHNYMTKKFKNSNYKIYRVPHHIAHASSSVFFSGFKKSTFLTLDGRGEFDSGIIGEFNNGEFEIFRSLKIKESLGSLYERFTSAMGFKAHSDEGKVMGLAPYGKPLMNNWFRNVVQVDKDYKIKINWKRINEINVKITDDPTRDERKNLAATVQLLLENTAVKLAEFLKEHSSFKQICLAGGTALNIDMNSKIWDSGYFNDIFIQPAAHDAGCSLGAAAYAYFQETGKFPKTKMKHAYWGAEYNNEEIGATLKKIKIRNYEFIEEDNIPSTVAELLSKNKTVAYFQGRFELGPRALGARSLLANPTKREMWKIVNDIKGREYWRPLAPSILEEKASSYLEKFRKSPFMLLSFKVKEEQMRLIPAVVHVDNTTRPQTVSREVNKLYWELIHEFENLTSVPVVINTSLNLRGEPIVNNPLDCIKTVFSSGIDYAIIGGYLIKK